VECRKFCDSIILGKPEATLTALKLFLLWVIPVQIPYETRFEVIQELL